MGGVGNAIVDERIGADLAKASCCQKRFDVRHQLGAESLPPELRLHPDAFEEWHWAGLTAVGVGAQRELSKPRGLALDGLGNEIPDVRSDDQCLDLGGVQWCGLV